MPLEAKILEDSFEPKGTPGWNRNTKTGGSPLGLCCCAIFCPCVTYGATLKKLPHRKFVCGGNYLGACLTYALCCWTTGGLGAGALQCCLRNGTANLKNDSEGVCCSCIYAYGCAPCSAVQMYKEANLRDEGDTQPNAAAPPVQTFEAQNAQNAQTKPKIRKPALCIVPQNEHHRPAIATWPIDTGGIGV
jgi:hypothetical protein